MHIQQTEREGVTIVAPAGRIDTTTSGAVEDVLRRAVDAGARTLVVDLREVDYISSAGLRVFLMLAKRMQVFCPCSASKHRRRPHCPR
jgi:anti-anti-sigma factor